MYTFTPNRKAYAAQSNADYAALIRKVRSMYCGTPLRVENGIVTALPMSKSGIAKQIGKITKD